MRKKSGIYLIIIVMTLIFIGGIWAVRAAQEKAATNSTKKIKKSGKLIVALLPEKNVFEQRRRYKYITDYLSKHLNMIVHADILSSYGDICDIFCESEADAGFFGSFSYVLSRSLVGVEPLARPVWRDGSSTYKGYIFVRKDSGIKTVADMKEKSLVLVDKATTAGYIFQLAYFQEHGVENMEKYFSRIAFAGSHDATAWAVYKGEVDVGGGKNHIFRALGEEYPDFKEQMVVLAESPAVPSNGLAVRYDLDPAIKKQLKDLLLNLDKTAEGRLVLKKFGALKFVETQDKDYTPLYKMIEKLNIDLESYIYKD